MMRRRTFLSALAAAATVPLATVTDAVATIARKGRDLHVTESSSLRDRIDKAEAGDTIWISNDDSPQLKWSEGWGCSQPSPMDFTRFELD